jgi:hypothetical protein
MTVLVRFGVGEVFSSGDAFKDGIESIIIATYLILFGILIILAEVGVYSIIKVS